MRVCILFILRNLHLAFFMLLSLVCAVRHALVHPYELCYRVLGFVFQLCTAGWWVKMGL